MYTTAYNCSQIIIKLLVADNYIATAVSLRFLLLAHVFVDSSVIVNRGSDFIVSRAWYESIQAYFIFYFNVISLKIIREMTILYHFPNNLMRLP